MADLNQLEQFAQVAHLRSFTKAAERLKVPKSTLSRSIGSLEARLGVQLIQRTTRTMRLTEAGKLFYTHCQRAIEQAELAESVVGSMRGSPKGTLRIATPIAFARFVIEPLLDDFLMLYPDLNVHIEMLNGIERKNYEDFDLVVRMGPLENSEWLVRPLTQVKLGLFASPSLFERHKRPEAPTDLQSLPCIVSNCSSMTDSGEHATWKFQRGHESREVRVPARVSVTDPAVHCAFAMKGVGLALLSENEARHHDSESRLEKVLPGWEPVPLELFALHPSRLETSPKVQAFLKHFASPS